MSKQIKVSDEVHQKLMGAKKEGETVSDLIARLLSGEEPTDEADKLLESLDHKYENQPLDPLIADLAPGELPPCCQEIYDDPEHPVPTCPHWEKAWVNYYGRKVVHYRNVLTGASYFDYFKKYTEK